METMEKEIFEYIYKNYWYVLPMSEEHKFTIDKCNNVRFYLDISEDEEWRNDCTEEELKQIAHDVTSEDIEIYTEDLLQKTSEAHAMRILQEKGSELSFLRCPICGQLARTPRAKQAKCGHRWDK